eukprot:TRINITY_DN8976_c0_g1_i1.p1 TRINITY_DN8976_c0_g1~~TRINITY_DN8976_c0_g1_i1.p1  ORF type:complete len:111 (-),score=16.15 TRINITY_DN8976_c0_g1_i1:60-392(-)
MTVSSKRKLVGCSFLYTNTTDQTNKKTIPSIHDFHFIKWRLVLIKCIHKRMGVLRKNVNNIVSNKQTNKQTNKSKTESETKGCMHRQWFINRDWNENCSKVPETIKKMGV